MARCIIINGHPDPQRKHFAYALADVYAQGAESAGHEVQVIEVATLDFPLLRSQEDYARGAPPDAIRRRRTRSAGPGTW